MSLVFNSKYGKVKIPTNVDVHSVVFPLQMRASNTIALVDAATGAKKSYKQLVADIDALVSALYATLNFKKWDVVNIFSPNHIQYASVVHAILKAGGTVSPANHAYNVNELVHQLRDSGAKFMFVHPSVISTAIEAARLVGIPERNIILFDDPQVGPSRRTVSQIASEAPKSAPIIKFTKEEIMNKPAYLCYSSGTTGLSKGVQTTQHNIISNVYQFEAYTKISREFIDGDVWVGVLPFYHIYGMMVALHMSLFLGLRLVVFQKFELEPFLAALVKYNVTTAHIVPPIALAIAKHPAVDKYKFKKLRAFMSGAAPLAPEIVQAIHKRLGVVLFQGYGLTETSPITHALPSALALSHASSIGHLIPNCEARLVDPDTGKDVGLNKQGELWIRGPNVMKGYHNNPEATANAIDNNGWFHTGDIAIADEDGMFYIVDRLKELIKYKGFQVPPAELEGYLLEHPSVADAAVIGRPDESGGEVPCAYVVLKSGAKANAKAIVEFVDDKVAPHKRLRGGVEFIAEIPRAASGKILRRVLREKDAALVKKSKL